eukprot:TRINITY_DN31810_c0_g1_i1.p1 TRINITY_DN31810_c0_g1~~TRINITY_DN31810_c0_g1_i1.p1  ORF type:complete len:172 (-),score=12.99 TRINITY_DN31810_c0_g1_i1:316-831(-)
MILSRCMFLALMFGLCAAMDDCPYFGKPCNGTHNCGWNDPDMGTKAACEHENIVCGDGKCILGPPMMDAASDRCPYFGKPCDGTHNCGWNDPDMGTKAVCEHDNIVCGDGKCILGPPMRTMESTCAAIGQPCDPTKGPPCCSDQTGTQGQCVNMGQEGYSCISPLSAAVLV